MSEGKTLCDLGMVTVDFGRSDAETPDPGNTFRLTFRRRNGQQTGRINVGISEAEQFTAELAAAMTAIAQLKSPPFAQSSDASKGVTETVQERDDVMPRRCHKVRGIWHFRNGPQQLACRLQC